MLDNADPLVLLEDLSVAKPGSASLPSPVRHLSAAPRPDFQQSQPASRASSARVKSAAALVQQLSGAGRGFSGALSAVDESSLRLVRPTKGGVELSARFTAAAPELQPHRTGSDPRSPAPRAAANSRFALSPKVASAAGRSLRRATNDKIRSQSLPARVRKLDGSTVVLTQHQARAGVQPVPKPARAPPASAKELATDGRPQFQPFRGVHAAGEVTYNSLLSQHWPQRTGSRARRAMQQPNATPTPASADDGGEEGLPRANPTSSIKCAGWLTKRATGAGKGRGLVKNWKRRWFELKSDRIQYFAAESGKCMKGEVLFTCVDAAGLSCPLHVDVAPEVRAWCFLLVSGKASMYVDCGTPQECRAWVSAIGTAISEWKRLDTQWVLDSSGLPSSSVGGAATLSPSSPVTPTAILLEGTLQKQSAGLVRRWMDRYFILSRYGTLSYAESKAEAGRHNTYSKVVDLFSLKVVEKIGNVEIMLVADVVCAGLRARATVLRLRAPDDQTASVWHSALRQYLKKAIDSMAVKIQTFWRAKGNDASESDIVLTKFSRNPDLYRRFRSGFNFSRTFAEGPIGLECHECRMVDGDGAIDGQHLTVVTATVPGSQAGLMDSIAIGSIVIKVGGTNCHGSAVVLSKLISSKPRPVKIDFSFRGRLDFG